MKVTYPRSACKRSPSSQGCNYGPRFRRRRPGHWQGSILAIPNRKKRQNPLSVPLDAKAVISHLREQGASAQTSGWHARLVRIVLKGTQDLPQQLLSALHGFIAESARFRDAHPQILQSQFFPRPKSHSIVACLVLSFRYRNADGLFLTPLS